MEVPQLWRLVMKKNKNQLSLISTIEEPGKEFVVGEDLKDTNFLPNSMVMSSFILGVDENNPNIGFHQVVMFRRGKGGKPSIKTGTLLAPIYHISELNMESLYSDATERKHFVILEESDDYVDNIENVTNTDRESLEGYIRLYAWLLSKAKFIKALDTRSQALENETAAILGPHVINRPKVVNKHNRIKAILSTLEESINHETPMDTWNRFIRDEKLIETTQEIRSAEHMLSIPRNYYIKSVNGLMYDSLQFLKNKAIKSDIKDKKEIIDAINVEKKRSLKSKEFRDKITKSRLRKMKNNQVELSGEDIF